LGCGDDLPPPRSDAAVRDLTMGPSRLSETGLYRDFASRALADGVLRYDVRYQLWSDGAAKERYFQLPPGSQIDTSDMDRWRFPVGTKAWKEFRSGGRLIETRLLHKIGEDEWWAGAFLWNDDESEALLAPDGQLDARGTSHDVPSQLDCAICHSSWNDGLRGVGAIQLSALLEWSAAGLLSAPPAMEFRPPGSGVVQDVLGYLHGNCMSCHHQSNLPGAVEIILELKVGELSPEDTGLYRTAIGRKTRHTIPGGIDTAIVPGMPDQSQLLVRMSRRDYWQMPPLASELVDESATAKVRDWILSLP
jgi:hypothetical protein